MGKLTSSIFFDISVFLLGLRGEQAEFNFFGPEFNGMVKLSWVPVSATLVKVYPYSALRGRGMAVLLLKQVVKNTAATVTQNSQD